MNLQQDAGCTEPQPEAQAQAVLAEMDRYMAVLEPLMVPWLIVFSTAGGLMYGVVSTAFFAGWSLMSATFLLGRFWALKEYHCQTDTDRLHDLPKWVRRMDFLSLFNGIAWGVALWVAIPELPLFRQMLLSWIPVASGAVAAISIPTGAISLRRYLAASFFPAIAAWLCIKGDGWIMALFMAVLVVIYDAIGRRHVQDVGDRMRYANELARANEMLEESNVSKTRLVVEASHDLRQPVHALGMMLDRLDVRDSERELDRRIHEIRSCVDTVADMLMDLLDLSRLETGDYVVDLQPVDLGRVLRELDEAYGLMAQRKGLDWIVTRSSAWVLSDPAMLRRVMNNLVSNAIKYTELGCVGISCRVQGDWVQLRVSDSGKGIPPDQMQAIFKEYVRLDDASQEPGYGVGLAVVKRMLDLLGHKLNVVSRIGEGSRFELAIRLVAAPECKPQRQPAQVTGLKPWLGKLIVFIENDEQLRSSTAEVLTSLGASVLASSSVSEVLAHPLLFQRRPDLLISDMHLGGDVHGLASIDIMRREYPSARLPAVLLTGDLTPALQQQARASEVRIAYKPVRPSRLRELVGAAFSGYGVGDAAPLDVRTPASFVHSRP